LNFSSKVKKVDTFFVELNVWDKVSFVFCICYS